MKDEFYTINEIATQLKVSYLTVYRWIKQGKLESTKIGRQHRVHKDWLQKFINSNKQKHGT